MKWTQLIVVEVALASGGAVAALLALPRGTAVHTLASAHYECTLGSASEAALAGGCVALCLKGGGLRAHKADKQRMRKPQELYTRRAAAVDGVPGLQRGARGGARGDRRAATETARGSLRQLTCCAPPSVMRDAPDVRTAGVLRRVRLVARHRAHAQRW